MTAPLHVLIVDDCASDAKLIVRALERTGRKVDFERVETRAAMQAALERQRWDIVLSDSSMPTFSALAALALLDELQVDVPFILVSGIIDEEVAVVARRAGAYASVSKDELGALGPVVERELRARSIACGS